jgi:hypothetical protein
MIVGFRSAYASSEISDPIEKEITMNTSEIDRLLGNAVFLGFLVLAIAFKENMVSPINLE